ncbi:hypothetical protein [Burkholderia perseverans]|uniref:hypothetical protein n=1 Tax=Burkholderia perseverans TaxID=2615214 RepID=UPI001FEDE3E0|nr:hypothetical protein [Burkholderia perseverans]
MANGLRIKNAAGQVILEITDRITCQKGEFTTNGPSGSVVVPVDGAQLVWAYCHDTSDNATTWGPQVWVDGNTVNWEYAGLSGNVDCRVTYGTY